MGSFRVLKTSLSNHSRYSAESPCLIFLLLILINHNKKNFLKSLNDLQEHATVALACLDTFENTVSSVYCSLCKWWTLQLHRAKCASINSSTLMHSVMILIKSLWSISIALKILKMGWWNHNEPWTLGEIWCDTISCKQNQK